MDLNLNTVSRCLNFYPDKVYSVDEIIEIVSSEEFINKVTLHDKIFELVLKEFNVTKEEMESKPKPRHIVDARKVYSYLAVKYSLATNFMIGTKTNKNHSTVNVSSSWIKNNVIGNKAYKELNEKISIIEKQIDKIK